MLDLLAQGLSKSLARVFGTRNDRILKAMLPKVEAINAREPELAGLSDADLAARTQQLKAALAADKQAQGLPEMEQRVRTLRIAGEEEEASELRKRLNKLRQACLDQLLVDAFALVREASKRTIGLRHFDVQLMGGMVLHGGGIAEMVTGEGKTLVATLPAVLNALEGYGVHVVTVNDYLARRDRDWMAPLYELLGLSVGAIQAHMLPSERIPEYACDITYGTNNEFGFDYLRDNMKLAVQDQAQRRQSFAIVDEVDSILIDEARTPLIISGSAELPTEKFRQADRAARQLKGVEKAQIDLKLREGADREVLEADWDFIYSEREHTVSLTERGIHKIEDLLQVGDIYAVENMDWPHFVENALRAHHLYKQDREYITKGDEVIIVDEFTGRLMPGRTWSDGLHQAVEAKEGIRIKEETQTLATITFQNFFRLYDKLAGMTGTAMTEAEEFDRIYKLDVVSMPTNRPLRRDNLADRVYLTEDEKFRAICREIEELHVTGRPILVGTVSIEKSERLSDMLRRRGIPHDVLNAKQHEREAQIVAQAGREGMVTIATNMAGRGTDIVLGGAPYDREHWRTVRDLDGLAIVGSERHEARRIDNQLRGRCGRQGDPGSSIFFLSLEDDFMRKFAAAWVSSFLKRLGMEQDQEISSPMVSRAIENAQKKVEAHNFEIRKNLLEYDEVMDEQRKLIYKTRQEVLEGIQLRESVGRMIDEVLRLSLGKHLNPEASPDERDLDGFARWFERKFTLRPQGLSVEPEGQLPILRGQVEQLYQAREQKLGPEMMRHIERFLLLSKIDEKWKDHLFAMDQLRSSIGFRGYAQVDPKVAYKKDGYEMFQAMIESLQDEVTDLVFRVEISLEDQVQDRWKADEAEFIHSGSDGAAAPAPSDPEAGGPDPYAPGENYAPRQLSADKTVGRNEPCPCGSGKKYKKCCGRS